MSDDDHIPKHVNYEPEEIYG